MKQIEVDIDVFAAIWQRREPGEDSENSILRRLLVAADRRSISHAIAPTQAEAKTSKLERGAEFNKETDMGKIRWVDDIRTVLIAMGGRAYLDNIYRAVEERRRAGGRSVPRTLDAVVRRTLEDHSSNSATFEALICFVWLVGANGRSDEECTLLISENPGGNAGVFPCSGELSSSASGTSPRRVRPA